MSDQKIAIILDEQLAPWQVANVSAFLSSGIPKTLSGETYFDQEQHPYLPLSRLPILIYGTSQAKVSRSLQRVLTKTVETAIFTFEMFQTFNDCDNRQTVINKKADSLVLAGLLVCGDKKEVDKIIRGLKFYTPVLEAENSR